MMLVVPVMFIELADAQIAATPEYLLKEGTVSELFMKWVLPVELRVQLIK